MPLKIIFISTLFASFALQAALSSSHIKAKTENGSKQACIIQGDVILSVNGKQLKDPAKAKSALDELSSSKPAVVLVLREGKEKKIICPKR